MMTSPTPTSREAEQASAQEKRRAQELLEQSGAPQLATQEAAESTTQPGRSEAQDQFAQRFGFDSYLGMFEASKPLPETYRKRYLATSIGPDQWIVWNEQTLQASQVFKSLEEATGHLSIHENDQQQSTPTG